MGNFLEYNPEQAYLLPPTVREVLGEEHLCFFVHRAVEQLDLRKFEESYTDEGHPAYHPALLLKVWLYAYALGVTSSRRLEQRIREDLAFRYLAGWGATGFLGAKRISQAAWASAERCIHAGGGAGASAGAGKIGTCGHRFDTHCRERGGRFGRQRGEAARRTRQDSQAHPALAATV